MSKPVNLLVMVHGISPEPQPLAPDALYEGLWRSLLANTPDLAQQFPHGYIGVSWGRELPQTPPPQLIELRPDQCLTRAQNFINERTSYEKIKAAGASDPNNPNNQLLKTSSRRGIDFPWFTPAVRNLVGRLREDLLIRGVGDAIYYGSRDGEFHIRRAVYGQVLGQLDAFLEYPDVRLHLIGHSLGVTITHDFLYGLFATDHRPGYYQQADDADAMRFERWRAKAQTGELQLGSLTSLASQLPLFFMRKQVLVDQFAAGELLRADAIGLRPVGLAGAVAGFGDAIAAAPAATRTTAAPASLPPVQWQLFYDVDDLLAFGTRRLYDQQDGIREVQVDTGDSPAGAHSGYWQHSEVVQKTAALLAANAE